MAGAYEPEEESSIDLVPEEKKSFMDLVPKEKKTVNTNATVLRMSNPLLDLFSRSAPKEKGKVSDFERHTIDLKMHFYHRSLCLPITYQVTSLYELRDVINNNNEGSHWLKFLSQAITYNNAIYEKASNEVTTYKILACKCKEKIKLPAQHFVDSKERFIAKEIDNENLQTKLNNVQTQLANVHMQRKDNVVILTATGIKYERFQQQVKNMQSQLDNACTYRKDSIATITDATTMAAIWHLRRIGPIELFSGEIVDDYDPWSYAICEKLKTNILMYVTKRQRVAYALSRMKSSFFDKIAA